ncbi:MAG TPA: M28 family peptidase, partial [Kofleriaceae bacterium]
MHRLSFAALALVVACSSSSDKHVDAGPTPPMVDSSRYGADLAGITGDRTHGNAHWMETQDRCAQRFEELGYTVERYAYATGVDVVGVLPGTTTPDERVYISAHYDTVTMCSGADDNGTGIAGVLEAARLLAMTPHKRTLVVGCWDEEERGLIGSKAYVTRAKSANEKIVGSFVFEMIGYKSE